MRIVRRILYGVIQNVGQRSKQFFTVAHYSKLLAGLAVRPPVKSFGREMVTRTRQIYCFLHQRPNSDFGAGQHGVLLGDAGGA